MSKISENLLYYLARRLYRTELAHSKQMKDAISSPEKSDNYRASQLVRIEKAMADFGLDIRGKTVLDLGCNDGAITRQYPELGAEQVIGVDINADAIEVARSRHAHELVRYIVGDKDSIDVPDNSVDAIICFDVFEHVARPAEILDECSRMLRKGGWMLIATWGWYHPFAPHLWATMPVPWSHVFFSEKTVLRVCRRVYTSDWYVPNMHDLDADGEKMPDKYLEDSIPEDYLNKLLIRDFKKLFSRSDMDYDIMLEPFGSRCGRLTKCFLKVPYLREFFASCCWALLKKS